MVPFVSRRFLRCWSVLLALAASSLSAQVVVTSYVETGNLPANDDNHSAAVSLGFSINFGGSTYSQTYVSNNGYITFGSGSGDYTPVAFDANYAAGGSPGLPIIAAFMSDVDTRGANSGIVAWGTGLVDGRAAFVAKWPSVGEYPYTANPNSSNSFEIVLVDRSDTGTGNFDVFFNYMSLNWDNGGAVAGFHNGSTTSPLFYQLPGSLTEGAFLPSGANDLTLASNTNSAGDILLQARNGAFLSVGTIAAIPEPSTYALMAVGGGLLLLAARRRRRA